MKTLTYSEVDDVLTCIALALPDGDTKLNEAQNVLLDIYGALDVSMYGGETDKQYSKEPKIAVKEVKADTFEVTLNETQKQELYTVLKPEYIYIAEKLCI